LGRALQALHDLFAGAFGIVFMPPNKAGNVPSLASSPKARRKRRECSVLRIHESAMAAHQDRKVGGDFREMGNAFPGND